MIVSSCGNAACIGEDAYSEDFGANVATQQVFEQNSRADLHLQRYSSTRSLSSLRVNLTGLKNKELSEVRYHPQASFEDILEQNDLSRLQNDL